MSSEPKEITLEFEVTEDDFVDFASYYYRYSAEGKRGRARVFLLGAALFSLFIYMEWENPEHGVGEPWKFAVYIGSAVFTVAAAYALYYYGFRPFIIRRVARSDTYRKMLGPTTLTIARRGITIRNEDGQGLMPWSDVHHIGETNRYVFLLVGPMRALIIPERAFPAGTQLDTIDTMRRWHSAG